MAAVTLLVTSAGLQLLGSTGTYTSLALPTGVTQISGARASVARLNGSLVITGAVSMPVWVQPNLSLSVLGIPKPPSAPTLATGAAGTYTGTRKARVSFVIKDGAGNDIGEGPLSDPTSAVTFASQKQTLSSLPVCVTNSAVTGRRIYVTANNGTDYFMAIDVDDNTTTSVTFDIADAALDIVAASTDLVTAPQDLSLVTTWKDRMWGVSGLDNLVGSGSGLIDRWPVLIPVDPRGTDNLGITGFLPRRDELGICRRNYVWKLTGSDETNYQLVKVVEGKGCVAPLSCVVIRDVGYFLTDDGVYKWDDSGVTCITDDTTRPWFTTDTYFNRAGFANALGAYDPVRNKYLLFLPVAGGSSTVLNRWIELDLDTGKWFGPHLCGAFTGFNGATLAPDANNVLQCVLAGSDNYLYSFDAGVFTDGTATAINFDVKTKFHAGDSPDLTHVWGQLTLFAKHQSGGTLTVIPYVGDTMATAGTAQSHDLTLERERLARFGTGRLCQLEFQQNTNAQGVELWGYLLPFVELGRR